VILGFALSRSCSRCAQVDIVGCSAMIGHAPWWSRPVWVPRRRLFDAPWRGRSLFAMARTSPRAMGLRDRLDHLVIELGIILALPYGLAVHRRRFVGGPLIDPRGRCCFGCSSASRSIDSARDGRPRLVPCRWKATRGWTCSAQATALLVGGCFPITSHLGCPPPRTFRRWNGRDFAATSSSGCLIAGAIVPPAPPVVPDRFFWETFFINRHPTLAALWGRDRRPSVAIMSFRRSIGNVPLGRGAVERLNQLRRGSSRSSSPICGSCRNFEPPEVLRHP